MEQVDYDTYFVAEQYIWHGLFRVRLLPEGGKEHDSLTVLKKRVLQIAPHR
jgi:hypothetical protein